MPSFPKPRPAALEREDRRKALKAADERENRTVKARSGGRCEVVIDSGAILGVVVGSRCQRRAVHVHHRIGGWGKRARGISADASQKLHLCEACHRDIHAHVLVPDGSYWRRVR